MHWMSQVLVETQTELRHLRFLHEFLYLENFDIASVFATDQLNASGCYLDTIKEIKTLISLEIAMYLLPGFMDSLDREPICWADLLPQSLQELVMFTFGEWEEDNYLRDLVELAKVSKTVVPDLQTVVIVYGYHDSVAVFGSIEFDELKAEMAALGIKLGTNFLESRSPIGKAALETGIEEDDFSD
jgi:hypothetical protein